VPQIAAVWQEGGTGQLSAFAVSFFHLFSPFPSLFSYYRDLKDNGTDLV
jgi:hypothetical protein